MRYVSEVKGPTLSHKPREGWGTRCFLEKGGGAALPGLAFFLGNFLYVVDVGTDLGDEVMQIVAEAEEGETFFKEFADARGAEQEESEDYIILACVFDQFLGGRVEFGRSVHVGELVFVVEAHGHAEIVLTEEKDVDAGDSGDFGDVFDAGCGPDLQGDDAFVVPAAGVAEQTSAIHAALREVDGA